MKPMQLPRNRSPRRARRGVLLLVILALLAMFGLVAVAFVVLTGQAMRSAKAVQRIDQYADCPREDLHSAAMEVFTGSNNPFSAVQWHNLLEDLYGNETVGGTLESIDPVIGGQLLEFTPGFAQPLRRVGCVLTFMQHQNGRSGPATGRSTRIVGSRVLEDGSVRLQIEALDGVAYAELVAGISQHGPIQYIVNGVPLSGAGFGYNPASGMLDATDPSGRPWALLPNPTNLEYRQFLFGNDGIPGTADDPSVNRLLPNEDYDAADFQNMLLAAQVMVNPATGEVTDNPQLGVVQTLPSLHRPALVNYWTEQGADADVLRKAILRPLPTDHPRFTGSNPGFHPVSGPWDVDNDGDGLPDSVWVDLGFPARAAADGKMYKPLFAILCVDLDGRLNLNAHGTWAQADPSGSYHFPSSSAELTGGGGEYLYASSGAAPQASVLLPRGLGHGPAEINLMPLFQYPGTPGNYFPNLLSGNSAYFGRYGERLGFDVNAAQPGVTKWSDPLSLNQHFAYPRSYLDVTTPTAYKSPPDMKGLMTVGLGAGGHPHWAMQNAQWTDMLVDHPYEMDLSPNRARGLTMTAQPPIDNPFSPAELERVLRPYDRDALTLPARLAALAPPLDVLSASGNPNLRRLVTTESWDLPVPPPIRTAALSSGLRQRLPDDVRQRPTLTLHELLEAIGVPRPRRTRLFPPEMLAGLRMNLNRPLGDGRDNQTQPGWGRGVVDEPGRVTVSGGAVQLDPQFPGEGQLDRLMQVDAQGNSIEAPVFDHVQGVAVPATVNADRDNRSSSTADAAMARQLYARYLFILAMLLKEEGFVFPTTENLQDGQSRELTVRRLAQWAVNVVDFYDSDAVMTPFEFDKDPFGGAQGAQWRVDGVVGTRDNPSPDDTADYRGLVWGCEAPEMILTETITFHDRRVVDSKWDSGIKEKRLKEDPGGGDPTEIGDPTLDQARISQGSAFLELYATRSPADNNAPAELYTLGPNGLWYLDLARMAPAGDGQPAYPVWRLVISESAAKYPRNDVIRRLRERPDSTSLEPEQYRGDDRPRFSLLREPADAENVEIERIVWLTDVEPQGHRDAERVYYRRSGAPLLRPGQYAVVGPRTVTAIGAEKMVSATEDGQKVGKPSKHAIILRNTVEVRDVDGNLVYPNDSMIKPPLALVVAAKLPTKVIGGGASWGASSPAALVAPGQYGIGLSVSEPLANSSDAGYAGYYPEPKQNNEEAQNMPAAYSGIITTDAYGDLAERQEDKGRYLDDPLDSRANMPLADEGLLGTGSTAANAQAYKYVFLQRLANPMQPYDPEANPYRTVDWMPIDLTVFNGEDREPAELPEPPGGLWDPDDPNPEALDNVHFETRQRGTRTPGYAMNLWTQWPSELPEETSNTARSEIYFRHELTFSPQGPYRHSLGFLNKWFSDAGGGQPWLTAPEAHKGDPTRPFPWIVWNNRPWVSQLELLQVPSSHPGRLLWEFNLAGTSGSTDPYTGARDPFSHLLSFFHSSGTAGGASELHRILEYVHVPSRFAGTETQIDPLAASQGYSLGGQRAHDFYPPFNRIPRYREPGRINLNTIYSPAVWQGLMNYFPDANTMSPSYWRWNEFVRSRRGYGGGTTIFDVNGQYPTFFARPFRSSGGANLAPLSNMRPTREVDATLLRSDSPGGASAEPLFDFCSETAGGTLGEHNDPDRNSYFRYQGLQRLGNLVTTRSNVYAVWITVGYFEVFPRAPDFSNGRYLDGWTLGPELGGDAGSIRRHRAFYLFDRSIPVGFLRGRDVNAEDAILIKRFIE